MTNCERLAITFKVVYAQEDDELLLQCVAELMNANGDFAEGWAWLLRTPWELRNTDWQLARVTLEQEEDPCVGLDDAVSYLFKALAFNA